MATKTRSSFLGTLVAVILVAGAAMTMTSRWGEGDAPIRHDKEEFIHLVVRFTPSPNHTGIHIKVNIEGVEVINYLADRSPWEHTQWIPKGAEVLFIAQQSTPDMTMCQIFSNTYLVANNVIRDREGSARCWHNQRRR